MKSVPRSIDSDSDWSCTIVIRGGYGSSNNLSGDPWKFAFLIDVAGDDECWVWSGSKTIPNPKSPKSEYGRIWFDCKTVYAHRLAYEISTGPIPDGMTVDHFKCHNTLCCNPAHLLPATQADNSRNHSQAWREAQAANRFRLGKKLGATFVRGRWQVYAHRKYLGKFDTQAEAQSVYLEFKANLASGIERDFR